MKVGRAIKIDKLVDAVLEELNDFDKYVSNTAIKRAVKRTSDEAVKMLRDTSPKKTGQYASDWTNDPMGRASGGKYTEIVYNSGKYFLTHLLEKGHRKKGKSGGRVQAYPHIAPVEQSLGDKIVKYLKEEVER